MREMELCELTVIWAEKWFVEHSNIGCPLEKILVKQLDQLKLKLGTVWSLVDTLYEKQERLYGLGQVRETFVANFKKVNCD